MRRRQAPRPEILAAMMPGKRAPGDRRIGRAKARGAERWDRRAGQLRQHAERYDIGGLALVGAHAERGVALHVLGGAVAFQPGKLDVLGGDVVLQIDEGRTLAAMHPPERRGERGAFTADRRHGRHRSGEAQIARGLRAEPRAVLQRLGKGEMSCRGAGHVHALWLRPWDEGGKRLLPDRLAAEMAGQMQRGIPAVGDREQIAGDLGLDALVVAHDDALKLLAASRLLHHGAGKDRPRSCALLFEALFSRIDHGGNGDAACGEVARRGPAIVGSGEHHGAGARRHAEAVEIAPHRRPKHHARQVVAGKGDAALDGAGGKHGALRYDVPGALARLMLGRDRHIVGHTLGSAIGAAVIDAEDRGARHDRHVVEGRELGEHRARPLQCWLAVNGEPLRQEPAAERKILLGENDPRAGAARGQRRHEACGASADDEHVAMGEGLLVMVWVRLRRRAAEPGAPADDRLVHTLPELRRPHEGLVVEARAEERAHQPVDRLHIEFQRRPAVLARGVEAIVKLDHGGARIGLAPRSRPHLDQRIRLLGAGAEDAARPVIFERAADQALAIGKQRRGERIARVAGIGLAVEGEIEAARPIDDAAGCEAERLAFRSTAAHYRRPPSAFANAALSIS